MAVSRNSRCTVNLTSRFTLSSCKVEADAFDFAKLPCQLFLALSYNDYDSYVGYSS